MKATITERAFIARMKRHLAKDGGRLCAPRYGTRACQNLGPFYTVDSNNIVDNFKMEYGELIKWAREDGVLKPHEIVEGLEAFEKGQGVPQPVASGAHDGARPSGGSMRDCLPRGIVSE